MNKDREARNRLLDAIAEQVEKNSKAQPVPKAKPTPKAVDSAALGELLDEYMHRKKNEGGTLCTIIT